eukprot:1177966-Prorocentrum_minimum.AAC.2
MQKGRMQTLDLSRNKIFPAGLSALAEALNATRASLQNLNLDQCNGCGIFREGPGYSCFYPKGDYDGSGMLALVTAMLKTPKTSLHTLNLGNNEINTDDMLAIVKALKGFEGSLDFLDLSCK